MRSLGITGISVLATLAVAGSPVANATKAPATAGSSVCNLASSGPVHQGDLVALPADTGSPADRYRDGRGAHPGQGKGLANAAANSPALQACGALSETVTPPVGGGTGTGGTGGTGASGEVIPEEPGSGGFN